MSNLEAAETENRSVSVNVIQRELENTGKQKGLGEGGRSAHGNVV